MNKRSCPPSRPPVAYWLLWGPVLWGLNVPAGVAENTNLTGAVFKYICTIKHTDRAFNGVLSFSACLVQLGSIRFIIIILYKVDIKHQHFPTENINGKKSKLLSQCKDYEIRAPTLENEQHTTLGSIKAIALFY